MTRFASTWELSRLPWFELREGRLVLADRSVGPIIDAHTHLALAYVRPMQVDLDARPDRVEHYLDMDGELDLDVYVNRNFPPADLRRMKRDLTLGSLTGRGMHRTHTAGGLLAEMEDLGIGTSILLPVDFPVLSHNADTYLAVAREHRRLVSLGSVHPLAGDRAGRLARQKALGARGIKVHPAVQLIAPDHPRAMDLYRHCAALKLPVMFHCGPVGIEPWLGRRLSQVKHYWRPIKENPDVTFVLGHSGALQWPMALDLAIRHDNVWLETSSQSLTGVRTILRDGPTDRVVFGTDWPFYHQSIALAKVLIATEGEPELRRRVLHDNSARLYPPG